MVNLKDLEPLLVSTKKVLEALRGEWCLPALGKQSPSCTRSIKNTETSVSKPT
jgi:hypothetical protein